jgi:hypothetical protein
MFFVLTHFIEYKAAGFPSHLKNALSTYPHRCSFSQSAPFHHLHAKADKINGPQVQKWYLFSRLPADQFGTFA